MSKIFNRPIVIGGEKKKVGTPSVTVLEYDTTGKVLRAKGTTVPTDADAGYAKGCIFVDTDASAGSVFYVNEGTSASCDFNVTAGTVGDITSVTAGAGLTGGGTSGAVTLNVVNTDGKITVGADTIDITAGSLVNADVNASAAIAYSKMAALTTNYILAGVSNVATVCSVAGDVTMTATGTTATFAIASGVVIDADVNASAAIAYSKLAALASNKILAGVSNVPTVCTVAGDLTMTSSGTDATFAVVDLTITSQAAGDIIYYNGSNWVRLAKPVSGTQYLQGGTTPAWSTVTAGIASDLAASVTVQNTTNDLTITSTDQTAAGESIVIPDFNAGGTTHTLAVLNLAQAWTADQTFTNAGIHILDTNASHDLILKAGSDLTADRILTITTGDAARTVTLGGDITTTGALITVGDDSLTFTTGGATDVTLPTTGTLATLAGAETFTNKTLTAPKIATGGIIADAGGDEYMLFTESATPVNYIGITSADTGVAPMITAGGSDDNIDLMLHGKGTGNVVLTDGGDITAKVVFEIDGATTAKTMTITCSHTDNRALTLPDATDTLVGKATTDTLTNKTIDADGTGNVISNINATELDPVGDAAFGIPFVISKTVAALAAAGTNIITTHPKMRILDVWFVATSADTGTLAVNVGQVGSIGAAITDTFTIPADDMQVTRCAEIDDAAWTVAENGGLVAVGDGGASIDGTVYVLAMRVD